MNRNLDINRYVFVLDTNVLLFDPNALMVFYEHDLMIPITVIEEIDRFKKDLNETGRNARAVSRKMDELRKQGSLADGVVLDSGSTLWIQMPDSTTELPMGLSGKSNDNTILQMCLSLSTQHPPGKVILVTRDTNMRIKADALGILAEDYEHAHIEVDEVFTGTHEIEVDAEVISSCYQSSTLDLESLEEKPHLYPNQFLLLRSNENSKHEAHLIYKDHQPVLLKKEPKSVWGVSPRNREQRFALELLLDPDISLVTLTGMAGTGKTLLAIAAGLSLTADLQQFRRLVVSRPIFPLGRDLGFLPGDVSEKLNPWMKPIFDNLEFLLGDNKKRNGPPNYQVLLDQNIIEVEPLTYIRGRSLPGQFLIVDEAQNLTPHEAKTVISRAGEGTKVVLTGDPYQIDNPYVDTTSNGLSYVVERLKKSSITAHVTLKKGERSSLAALAARLL
ncbi:MAG: PhoH family protein [Myxococcota bacterium]|nr:PhoH family protein [Myxococcota bacterium]